MKKKGFTLLELMIAMGIFAIFSVYLYQSFFSQLKQSFNFNNRVDIQSNANKALNILTDELRNYSFTPITFNNVSQVLSNGNVIIDLSSNVSIHDIDYNSSNKILSDSNGNQCFNIDSIEISQGVSTDETELIIITVSSLNGNTLIKSSTAVNIKK